MVWFGKRMHHSQSLYNLFLAHVQIQNLPLQPERMISTPISLYSLIIYQKRKKKRRRTALVSDNRLCVNGQVQLSFIWPAVDLNFIFYAAPTCFMAYSHTLSSSIGHYVVQGGGLPCTAIKKKRKEKKKKYCLQYSFSTLHSHTATLQWCELVTQVMKHFALCGGTALE